MSEIEELKKQIQALTEELEVLKSEKKASVQDDVVKKIEEKLNLSKDEALQIAEKVSDEVKKSPLKSLAIALGVGFIAARVLK